MMLGSTLGFTTGVIPESTLSLTEKSKKEKVSNFLWSQYRVTKALDLLKHRISITATVVRPLLFNPASDSHIKYFQFKTALILKNK